MRSNRHRPAIINPPAMHDRYKGKDQCGDECVRHLSPLSIFVPILTQRLTRFAVNYLVNRTAEAAGFTNLHPHCLRHSGYVLAGRGVDLRTIQEWARASFD